MNKIILFLMFCGCSNITEQVNIEECEDAIQEFTAKVPYSWAVMDEELNYIMDNGCILKRITHYVFDEDNIINRQFRNNATLPIGFIERGCGYDGCQPQINNSQSLIKK